MTASINQNPYSGSLITTEEARKIKGALSSASGSGQLLVQGVKLWPCHHSVQQNEAKQGDLCPDRQCKQSIEAVHPDRTVRNLSRILPMMLAKIRAIEIVNPSSPSCLSEKEVLEFTKIVEEFHEELLCSVSTEEMTEGMVLIPCAHRLQKVAIDEIIKRTTGDVKCPMCRTPVTTYTVDPVIQTVSKQMCEIFERLEDANKSGSKFKNALPKIENNNNVSNNNNAPHDDIELFKDLFYVQILDLYREFTVGPKSWVGTPQAEEILRKFYQTFKNQLAQFNIDNHHPQFRLFLEVTTEMLRTVASGHYSSSQEIAVIRMINDFHHIGDMDITNGVKEIFEKINGEHEILIKRLQKLEDRVAEQMLNQLRKEFEISNNNNESNDDTGLFEDSMNEQLTDFVECFKNLINTNPKNWAQTQQWKESLRMFYQTFKNHLVQFDIDENHPQFNLFLKVTINRLIEISIKKIQSGLFFHINEMTSEFRNMAFFDGVNSFASQPVGDITIDDFKERVNLIHRIFPLTPIQTIELHLRQAIVKKHNPNDFVTTIALFEGTAHDNPKVAQIKLQLKEKLKAKKAAFEKELTSLRGPDGFNGTLNEAYQQKTLAEANSDQNAKQRAEDKLSRLTARFNEIAQFEAGTSKIVGGRLAQVYADLDETALNVAARKEANKRVDFYKLLSIVVPNNQELQAHVELHQVIG